jgi:hypothetical protein
VLTRATYSLVSSTPEVKCSTFDDDALHEGIHFKAKVGSFFTNLCLLVISCVWC